MPHGFPADRCSRLALGLGLCSLLPSFGLGLSCTRCAHARGTAMLSCCSKALMCCPLLLTPIFAMHPISRVNFRALDKRCPTVQSKEKTWHLTAGKRLQLVQRWLWVESWCSPKSIDHRIQNLQLLFFPSYTKQVYDLLLLHSLYNPEGAVLEGISAQFPGITSSHSQEGCLV